jgi:hypothetical protein
MGLQIRQKLSSPGSIWVGLSVFAIDDLSLIAYWGRQLDAPDGAVIGVPGKARRPASDRPAPCKGDDGRAAARIARTARSTARKEAQRCMAPQVRCWRVHGALTHAVNAIEAVNA